MTIGSASPSGEIACGPPPSVGRGAGMSVPMLVPPSKVAWGNSVGGGGMIGSGFMKRGHTAIEYKSKIRALRKIRPNLSMSSDFIIGFPGETQADFADTMKLIDDIGYDLSFSFIYSARPGTPAADIVDDVSEDEKKQRLYILQDRINQSAQRIARNMLDTEQRILVEGPSKKNPMELTGRTENNRVVNFEGSPDMIGQFVDVKVTDVYTNSLRGDVIRRESDMGLRVAISPQSILAKQQDSLGVQIVTPKIA